MLEAAEKIKYSNIWRRGDYTSRSAEPFARYLKGRVNGDCLEIGAGKGMTAQIVSGFIDVDSVVASDIVTDQIPLIIPAIECPAWDIIVPSKKFDYSFSTDVLEHIPTEKIESTIKELARVTKIKTIHQIATFPMGDEHLTVRPITWWNMMFAKHCEIEFEIIERTN